MMTLREAITASVENILDEGGTIEEHAELLRRDYGLGLAEATSLIRHRLPPWKGFDQLGYERSR